MTAGLMRSEPEYIVELSAGNLTMWTRVPERREERRVPVDGSIMIRDADTGEIVGKRLEDIGRWNLDAALNSFATAFGWGTAGPAFALRKAADRIGQLVGR